jgi:hypothetical protein
MGTRKKHYLLVGLFCFLGLFILGIFFFKERIAFSDTAYQAVYLLIEHKPFVIWVRPGAILPQLIPLTAIWLHAGLKTVMVLHSLSFLIFFLIIYLLAYKYSKSKLLFFVIPLYLVLITNEVFYWPQSELQQGMIWLCLYAVFLFENKWANLKPWLQMGIHFMFILWIQSFHPLLFFPIAFLVFYYYISESQLYTRKSFYHLSICGLSFSTRSVIGLFDHYERGKFNIIKPLIKHHFRFLSLDSVNVFMNKLSSEYLVYILFLLFAVFWLAKNRKYKTMVMLILFSVGYWVLIMAASADSEHFLWENMLLPLAFMVSLPFISDIIPKLKLPYLPVLFSVVIAARLVAIYNTHTDYTAHYDVYDPYFKYVYKNNLNGVFVDDTLVNKKKAIITWASGYESILISSLRSPDSCRVIQITKAPNYYRYALNFDTSLVTIFGIWDKSQMPERYFRLAGGKYEILTTRP